MVRESTLRGMDKKGRAMATPDNNNVTGVESFDHSELRQFPEYHAVRQAMQDLIEAMNASETCLTQQHWLKACEQMAASLPFADISQHERDTECSYSRRERMVWPYRAVIEDGWLQGSYRCPECGEEWTCGYAIGAPAWR